MEIIYCSYVIESLDDCILLLCHHLHNITFIHFVSMC